MSISSSTRSATSGKTRLPKCAARSGRTTVRSIRLRTCSAGCSCAACVASSSTRAMSEKAFHDEILRQGSMPIAFIRLALGKPKLTRDMNIDWEFYGPLPSK